MSFTTLPIELQLNILEFALSRDLCRADKWLEVPIMKFATKARRIVIATPSSIPVVVRVCESHYARLEAIWMNRPHRQDEVYKCTDDDRIRCWRCKGCQEQYERLTCEAIEGHSEDVCLVLAMLVSGIECFGTRLQERQTKNETMKTYTPTSTTDSIMRVLNLPCPNQAGHECSNKCSLRPCPKRNHGYIFLPGDMNR
jgi:hypothetical protein